MNFVIITQVRNQGNRIYDWIKYHHENGFDSFVIYDDYSEDDTLDEIHRAKKDFPGLNIYDFGTDGLGNKYDCKDSEVYGNDKSLHDRLNRSYTNGNNFVKQINPNAVCAIIDVDEFLASDYSLKNTIDEIFAVNNCQQILVQNLEIKHDYDLEKGFIYKNQFKCWDRESVNKHPVWSSRSKAIFISKFLDVCNFVHAPITDCNTLRYRDYTKLRMYHFRVPNLPDNNEIPFIYEEMEF